MTAAPERLDALTGLRFVAAAAVFVYHVPCWLPVPDFNPGMLGKAAVGYFFVLSGFILAHVYRRDAPLTTGRFWLARFARIWPLHAACLLAMLWVRPHTWPGTTDQVVQFLTHATLLQGWTTNAERALAWNGPAWSLSVEMFFYALFPLLVQRRAATLVALYLACCLANGVSYGMAEVAIVRHPEQTPAWGYFTSSFPLLRLQEFVLGLCTHDLWRRAAQRGPRGACTATAWEVAAFAAAIASFLTWSGGQWGAAWIGNHVAPMTVSALANGPGLSWAFAATVAMGASGRGWISRALALPGMVYLGEISYAVYLVHTPVMALVADGMREFRFLWHVPLLVGATATLAAAAWLHALIELPARQAILARGQRWSDRGRVYLATTTRAMGSHAFRITTALGVVGLALAWMPTPTVADLAHGIARRSAPALRGLRYAADDELLGASFVVDAGGFTCWIAWRSGDSAGTRVALEARTGDGRLVHTLTTGSESGTAADGSRTTLVTARAALQELFGASVLALVVRTGDGTVVPPSGGPIAADGVSLEILRLP